jgi:hypothetical protein
MRHDPFETIEEAFFRKWFASADFDPTGGLLTAGMMAAGAGLSATGTLAGGANAATTGRMQQQAQQFQATQDTMNSAADIAGAQRQAIDTSNKANLTRSSAVAGAAAGGVVTTSGSAVTNQAQITARGSYASALDLWNGQNAASSDLNKAAAAQYQGTMDLMGGQMQQEASEFAAAGTLAGAGGTAFKLFRGGGPSGQQSTQTLPGMGYGYPTFGP